MNALLFDLTKDCHEAKIEKKRKADIPDPLIWGERVNGRILTAGYVALALGVDKCLPPGTKVKKAKSFNEMMKNQRVQQYDGKGKNKKKGVSINIKEDLNNAKAELTSLEEQKKEVEDSSPLTVSDKKVKKANLAKISKEMLVQKGIITGVQMALSKWAEGEANNDDGDDEDDEDEELVEDSDA